MAPWLLSLPKCSQSKITQIWFPIYVRLSLSDSRSVSKKRRMRVEVDKMKVAAQNCLRVIDAISIVANNNKRDTIYYFKS